MYLSRIILSFMFLLAPANTLQILQLSLNATETFEDIWNHIDLHLDPQIIFQKMERVILNYNDLHEQLQRIDEATRRINEYLPEYYRQQLRFKQIRAYQTFIDDYYQIMNRYITNYEDTKNLGELVTFSNKVLSTNTNSVRSLARLVYQYTIDPDFLLLCSQQFAAQEKETQTRQLFCKGKQAPQQMFVNLLQKFTQGYTKSFIIIQFSYLMKYIYERDDRKEEVLNEIEKFKARIDIIIAMTTQYMVTSSKELWNCDPEEHIAEKTYVTITNLIRGYIINEANLNPLGECYGECKDLSYTNERIECTTEEKWCKRKTPCNKILECESINSDVEVCLGNPTLRRYEYIKDSSGKMSRSKKQCRGQDLFYLTNYDYKLLWTCSYCFCLCDEGPKQYSHRYINLRAAIANLEENRVVIGLRFVKHNRIMYLQIQEGKLLPYGQIDARTVRWVPIEKYSTIDRNKYKGQDFHEFSWKERGMELQTIVAQQSHLITGLRFRRLGERVDLEVLTTPFNFTTGKLDYVKSFYIDDSNLERYNSGKELKLIKPDISTRANTPSNPVWSAHYVKFTNTDYEKDAAQTTVPFLDAQPVESLIPVPLSGVGIMYKGHKGYGGFIAPHIIVYDYSQHLEPIFMNKKKHE